MPARSAALSGPLMAVLEELALAAGEEIFAVVREGICAEVKADATPVTEADRRSEAVILAGLASAFPDIPVIAEEEAAEGRLPLCGNCFFLVDPLDGTREFVAGRNDYTINIALIEDGVPVAGIVYAPARGIAWTGVEDRAEKLTIETSAIVSRSLLGRKSAEGALRVVASKSHLSEETAQFIDGLPQPAATVSVGSSIKFCYLAEGSADLYPRFSRTMEWDTAAGDAVLRAAGGSTLVAGGLPLTYGKRDQGHDCDFANPWFLSHACGCPKSWEWPA